jgi:hypothetical protein
MSGLFKILFDLQIKSHNQPLEDYLTEIFTYCLSQDRDMLNAFLKELNIVDRDIDEYTLTTQYELKALANHSVDSRPDMALFSNDTTIFFENKIDAKEGDQQLQRYAEHLNHTSSGNKILVYITRDYDPKEREVIFERCKNYIKFIQLRWYEIFRFLKAYMDNPIVLELLKFMKQNKLAMNNQYSPIDILTMTNFSRVHKIMDETMFGETSLLFEKVIGKKRTQDSTRLTQLENHDRYVYYAAYKNKLHIFLGYWMNSDNEKEYPEVGVELDISPNAEINSTLKNIFKEISDKYETWKSHNLNDPKRWAIVFRKKSLQEFLSESDHVESIKSYLKDVLGDLDSLFTEHPILKD